MLARGTHELTLQGSYVSRDVTNERRYDEFDSTLMRGVRFFAHGTRTASVVMQTNPNRIRFIDSIQVASHADARARPSLASASHHDHAATDVVVGKCECDGRGHG